MKYQQLTKEQLEELHEEFSKFLATQKIDKKEWDKMKAHQPDLAQEEIDVFSDLIWEKVLDKTSYLEHYSNDSINLFKCNPSDMQRIVVTIKKEDIDLYKDEDFKWFLNNSNDESIEYLKGQKHYANERNIEIFELIKKGSVIAKGDLFEALVKIIN